MTFPSAQHQEAIIIGAGLAGCAIAMALNHRGWKLHVIDRRDDLAQEASGNHLAIFMPQPRPSLLANLAFNHLLALLQKNPASWWRGCGVLQLKKNPAHKAVGAQSLTAEELTIRFDLDHSDGALWYPQAGILKPHELCRLMLPAQVQRIFSTVVCQLIRRNDLWYAHDAHGSIIAAAPVLILACAMEAKKFFPHLPLSPVRGQISYLPAPPFPALDHVRLHRGYLTPAVDKIACLGATFTPTVGSPHPIIADHQENLHHLTKLLPSCHHVAVDATRLEGRVAYRCVTPDRQPLVGSLSDNLFVLLGLGSWGTLFAPLCGELLASQICHEPPAVVDAATAAMLAPQRSY